MLKKLLLILSLLSLFAIPSIAQESETQTIVISETELNAFIDEQVNERNLEIHLTASLKGGMVMINLVGTRPNGNEFHLELAMIASLSLNYERIEWTVVDWAVTDAEGNELDIDEDRIYPMVENFLGRWRELSARLFRSKVSESASGIKSIEIIEGQIMFETLIGGESTNEERINNLPDNVTDNGDGTFTISISQDMINNAFAVIVERNENLSSFMVEIEGINAAHFTVRVQAKALCNNEVIEGAFSLVDSADFPVADSDEQFIVGDWNGDGIDDIASIFIPRRTYAVLQSTMTCEGEAFTQEQNQRVMGLLLPAVQRFIKMQVLGSVIVDFEVRGSIFEITVEPPQR